MRTIAIVVTILAVVGCYPCKTPAQCGAVDKELANACKLFNASTPTPLICEHGCTKKECVALPTVAPIACGQKQYDVFCCPES